MSSNCTGSLFWSLWFCVQKLVQEPGNCLKHTTDPPEMFINGVWTWMILSRVSLFANDALYVSYGSCNMYFQFLGALFWGDFGTYIWWLIGFRQRTTAGLAMDYRVGLRWHFHCGCPISKPRPFLDFSSKKSGVIFFSKSRKNKLIRPKTMFLVILAKIRSFSDM